MKNVLLLSVGLFISNLLGAQKISSENLPLDVASSFKNKYSTAEKASWEMDYDNYQVNFTFLKTDMTALFNPNGEWLETDAHIKETELPKEVKDSLTKHFGAVLTTYNIEEAQKIESPKRDMFYYLVVVQNLTTYDMVLKENGHIVLKEKRTDDSEGVLKFKKTKKKEK